MILAWVASLVLLCSSLVMYLEGLSSLRVIQVNAMQQANNNFIAAERSVLECEKNLTNLTYLDSNDCFIQSVGKNRWLISSKIKPEVQISVVINEKTGAATRMNWRQVFE